MTEEEAKTKTCCASFSPVAFTAMNVGGGVYQSIEPRNCIGSACMAFRQHGWRDKEDGQFKSMSYEKADAVHWKPMFHCGLAGKP